MSALSNMPLQAVLPLNAYDLDDLKRLAERSDQLWLYVNCSQAKDHKAVFAAIAKSFAWPKPFEARAESLYASVTALQANPAADSPGMVVVLQALPESPQFSIDDRDALLDVFRDASDFFAERKIAFRIFYSVDKVSKH
jgi:Barstar (barnase inhibitor)